jgi:D-alanyl-D-alanine carboxypeptidase
MSVWSRRLGAVGAALTVAMVAPSGASAAPPPPSGGLDRAALSATLEQVHDAGMYGVFSAADAGPEQWRGAAGVADIATGRPVHPRMQQRVGSVTKTFTAAAVLTLVAEHRIDLDSPIGRYLPKLVPGDRGQRITVRMLLNHTSGIGDYIGSAFPSLLHGSAKSLDDNRFRRFSLAGLARLGLAAPSTGDPGARWSYSNTNYILAGLLIERVTGVSAESYITRTVIAPAGLEHTYFPRAPRIVGPHSKMYENWYGLIDPPKDYSVYDMSWAGTAGALVSTTDDLNRFYRLLLTGRVLPAPMLREMQTTVPVYDPQGNVALRYGLGIYQLDSPCGPLWGHDGAVFGAGTQSLSTPDGRRQVTFAINLMKYQRLGPDGMPMIHPIDIALARHLLTALCPPTARPLAASTATLTLPLTRTTPLA